MGAADRQETLQTSLGGAYTIERELGRGGMATVYLARDAKHNRLVALKVLHADLAASLGPERFRREITFAATLQHPHILTVLDSGEAPSGQLWFTMPYIEGQSLRDRLRTHGPMPVEDALRIAQEAADAIEYAHRHGVIHRDIKPENILLTGTHALVADFGIARALATGGDGPPLTATGLAVGTPAYMSPEQASAEPNVDARTDVYSLGVVLFEMLAGEPPYTGPTAQAVIAKMMAGEPPSLRRTRPAVPEAVDTVVRKALSPVPGDRYPTAAAFGAALESVERLMISNLTETGRAQRFPVRVALVGLGVLVVLGAVFAWNRRTSGAGESTGPPTVAVLPFENVGDSSDAYFADGITEEVRGKLAALHGLRVIASTSSGQYRHTTKTTQEIARELGAQYVLVGRVRWQKAAGGTSRVRVDPELVKVFGSGPPATAWQQNFDADLRDVFQVQSDIAGRVAEQLQLTLGADEQHELADRPTANLAAYDAYLRGQEIITVEGPSAANNRRAELAYGEAVRLDSTFALAWAALGESYAALYANDAPTPALRDSADRASARALALAPDLPEAHVARGRFYGAIRLDFARALAEYEVGIARTPYNAHLLMYTARTEASLQHWDAAVRHLEDAARIDPRDADIFARLGETHIRRRDYPAARLALERATALQPRLLRTFEDRAMLAAAQGDLAGARSVLRSAPASVDRSSLVAFVAQYFDLGWVLDSADERLLLTLGPKAFGGERANWAFALAQQYRFRGDRPRARAYADTARAEFAALAAAEPGDPQSHLLLGLALAYLGRKAEAIREGERGLALAPLAKDAVTGAYYQQQLVRIYMAIGEPEKALDALEPLLVAPHFLSPAWLTIDPNFAPLRGNPRFEKLIASARPIA
jgi:serine/threonine-protein kinase